jgi:hypothetical protein
VKALASQEWWTAADAAELDVLIHEFLRAVYRHRDVCAICSGGGPWCTPLRQALEGVLEWRDGRVLRSKADWLRLRHDLRAAARPETGGGLF